MEIKVIMVPEFNVEIEKDLLELLIKCSKLHYSHECVRASEHDGFLYGWRNRLENGITTVPYQDFRTLDTCGKILEILDFYRGFTRDEVKKLKDFKNAIFNAIKEYNTVFEKQKAETC